MFHHAVLQRELEGQFEATTTNVDIMDAISNNADTPNSKINNDENSSGLVIAIVGGVVGLMGIAGIVAGVAIYRRRKKKLETLPTMAPQTSTPGHAVVDWQ